jgi:hypothetical protein
MRGWLAGGLTLRCSLISIFVAMAAFDLGAAPISGSFQVDLVMHSVTCGVDEDGDTFIDEDLSNTVDDDGDSRIDEDGCFKVDDTIMKFEADLVLQMSISGLQIGSTTVFTFKGLEYQSFTVNSTIGALSIKDTFVFAPSVTEIEFVRTSLTLTLRYCVSAAAPSSLSATFLDCPTPDSLLYWLIEAGERFHPAVANLRLAQIYDSAGMLDEPLVFRKKIVELTLNIAGLAFSTRALFVNIGGAQTPSYQMGLIAAIEGQTVSGILFRAETWLGARQGLECFAECKPAERIYGGIVAANTLAIQEEKLFVRNVTLAGVTFNLRAEFQFFTNPFAHDCINPGLCYLQIDSRAKIQPLNLILKNEVRFGPDLNPRFDLVQTDLRFGDVAVTALWYFYPSNTGCGGGCVWESQLVQFISTFDPPGLTLTSDLTLCSENLLAVSCSFSNGTLEHNVYFSSNVGNLTIDARAIFLGLITGFSQLWIDLTWQVGNLGITTSAVFASDAVEAIGFSFKGRF